MSCEPLLPYSVMTPAGVPRPTFESAAYQTLPSGPAVMPYPALSEGMVKLGDHPRRRDARDRGGVAAGSSGREPEVSVGTGGNPGEVARRKVGREDSLKRHVAHTAVAWGGEPETAVGTRGELRWRDSGAAVRRNGKLRDHACGGDTAEPRTLGEPQVAVRSDRDAGGRRVRSGSRKVGDDTRGGDAADAARHRLREPQVAVRARRDEAEARGEHARCGRRDGKPRERVRRRVGHLGSASLGPIAPTFPIDELTIAHVPARRWQASERSQRKSPDWNWVQHPLAQSSFVLHRVAQTRAGGSVPSDTSAQSVPEQHALVSLAQP